MLLHRHGHSISAFALVHHRRFAGPSIHTARWQLSNRTSANAHPRSRSKRPQERLGASRFSRAQHHFSTVARTTSSFSNAQRFVRDPFKILFCGRDLFSCTVFKEVHEAKDVWDSLHVVTNADIRTGRRGSRLDISPLKVVGEAVGVPVHTIPEDKAAFRKWLPPPPFTIHSGSWHSQNASHLLITASFGRILPKPVLSLFSATQRLNVHPSLLPAYRGPAPIQRALMAGEQETGVCVIEMGEVNRKVGKLVDAGDIWAVERIHAPEDAGFLYMQDVLAASGGKLLVQVLRDMLSGRAQSRPQEEMTLNTAHAPLITAADSAIHFASQTALVITRLERAIGHQRKLTVAAALPDGRGVVITGLQVIPPEHRPEAFSETDYPGSAYYSRTTRSLVIQCAEGTWLSVDRLQTQDRAILAAQEWWNGVKGMGWVKDGVLRFK